MFRMFSFLPPIGFYVLAICAAAATYSAQDAVLANNPDADVNKIWLVGGIVAFLLAFGGFQKSLENRAKANQPRVSSADVMQKLTPTETGTADRGLARAGRRRHDEGDPASRVAHSTAPASSPWTSRDAIVSGLIADRMT